MAASHVMARLPAGGGGGGALATVTVAVPEIFSVVVPSGSVAVAVALRTAESGLVAGVFVTVTIPRVFGDPGSGATVNSVGSELLKTVPLSVAFDGTPGEISGLTVKPRTSPG